MLTPVPSTLTPVPSTLTHIPSTLTPIPSTLAAPRGAPAGLAGADHPQAQPPRGAGGGVVERLNKGVMSAPSKSSANA
eukprot:5141500-Pyramimonas_sp.AAC.1